MSKKPLYRVKDWEKHFEISQSRRSPTHRHNWVALPNKHDGKGYRRLMRRKNGPTLYAAWILIVQVASKCPKRGILADEDGPLTAEDLADKTDAPAKIFSDAFKALTENKIGWLEVDSSERGPSGVRAGSDLGILQDITEHNITEQDITVGSSELASPTSEPPLMVFSCIGNGPKEWHLTKEQLENWSDLYPDLDILKECREAKAWGEANHLKTAAGMKRYLVNWFNRTQSKGSFRKKDEPELQPVLPKLGASENDEKRI